MSGKQCKSWPGHTVWCLIQVYTVFSGVSIWILRVYLSTKGNIYMNTSLTWGPLLLVSIKIHRWTGRHGFSFCIHYSLMTYRIQPNYCTVRLGISKLLGTLICGKICIYLPRIHYKKRSEKNVFDDDYAGFFCFCFFSDFLYNGICCGYSFELHRQVDAIQMSIHNICLYKEVKKKYTGCNLKTTEFLVRL